MTLRSLLLAASLSVLAVSAHAQGYWLPVGDQRLRDDLTLRVFASSEAARGAIRTNLDALNLLGAGRVHRRDATDLGQRPASDGAPFDIAFLDPPYGKGLGETALTVLLAGGWLAPGALTVLERGAADPRVEVAGFEPLDERIWGPAAVSFLRVR